MMVMTVREEMVAPVIMSTSLAAPVERPDLTPTKGTPGPSN